MRFGNNQLRASLSRLTVLHRSPVVYHQRVLSIGTNYLAPKGFGNFKGKSTKSTGRKSRSSSESKEAAPESPKEKDAKQKEEEPEIKEKTFEFKFELGGGGKDPKKNPKDNKKKNKNSGAENGPLDNYGFVGDPKSQWLFIGFIASILLSYLYENDLLSSEREVAFTQFLNDLKKGSVESVNVVNREYGTYKTKASNEFIRFPIGSVDQLETQMRVIQSDNEIPYENRVSVNYVTTAKPFSVIANNIFPVMILAYFITKRAKDGQGFGMGGAMPPQTGGKAVKGKKGKQPQAPPNPFNPMGNTTKSTATIIDPEDIDVRFTDVAGCDESKVEIMEFVNFLKHPENYEALGAKIPKGAILNGPPGTGKTLLGKATAGEAGVTFISVNGSEFQEMFVGVGAARVRDMFNTARENSPAILFIDEIDAVGRKRGGRMGSGEADVTLNQILTEMDGFNSIDDNVVVMAATNRLDTLDDALLRPGRFDRQIYIGAPDIKGRAQILKIHLKNKKLAPGMDLEETAKKLAARTPGMAGADLANVCNEGALIAARNAQKHINFIDFNRAIDRVVAGIEKKGSLIKPHEKSKIAHHEAGHAVTGWFLEHADPLVKVTIVPRGKALGFAMYQPSDLNLMPEEQILDRICVSLGGRIAEDIFFNSVTTGASDDLDKVTKMAYAMVTQFGFSKKIGQVNYSNMGDGMNKPYSEETGREIDSEVKAIIDKCWDRTYSLLTDKKEILESLAGRLLEQETIERADLVEILGERPFKEMTTYEEYVEGTGSVDGSIEDDLPEGLKGWKEPAKNDSKEEEQK